jgi:hypothetical protein
LDHSNGENVFGRLARQQIQTAKVTTHAKYSRKATEYQRGNVESKFHALG